MEFLWKLYCFPGRLSNWFDYLYPRSGRAWGTARRKDNQAAHFFTSTALYALLIVLFFLLHRPTQRPSPETGAPQSVAAAGSTSSGRPHAHAAGNAGVARVQCIDEHATIQGVLTTTDGSFVLTADEPLCLVSPGGTPSAPGRRIWLGLIRGGGLGAPLQQRLRTLTNHEVRISGDLSDPSNVSGMEAFDFALEPQRVEEVR